MSDWNPTAKTGYKVNRAARLFAKLGEERLRTLDIGVAYIPVFAALADGVALPQKELTRLAQIEQPTMALLLARMELAGLVERRPDPQDGRSDLITLTKLARSRVPAARQMLVEGNDEAVEGFTADEVTTFGQLLDRLVRNLENANARRRPPHL